jgi:preprotein translocase subunit SecA
VTYQTLFSHYGTLAGMTGTAAAQAGELWEAYGLDVVRVPPHRPSRRADAPLALYAGRRAWEARLVREVGAAAAVGRPVLVGTATVAESEAVFALLEEIPLGELSAREAEDLQRSLGALPPALLPDSAAAAVHFGEDHHLLPVLRQNYSDGAEAMRRLAAERRFGPTGTDELWDAAATLAYAASKEMLAPDAAAAARAAVELVRRALARGTLGASARMSLLNARPELARREAETIAQAGLPGSVTVATAMAGRGTDILLGGSPKGLALLALAHLLLAALAPDDAADLDEWMPPHAPLEGVSGAFASDAAMRELLPEALYDAIQAAEGAAAAMRGRGEFATAAAAADRLAAEVEAAEEERSRLMLALAGGGDGGAEAAVEEAASWVHAQRLAPGSPLAAASDGAAALRRLALMLWRWFDVECARHAARVRDAGGLLVVLASLQGTRRAELQLRGRAGRQGDPGASIHVAYAMDEQLAAVLSPQQVASMRASLNKSAGLADPQNLWDPSAPVPDALARTTAMMVSNVGEAAAADARLDTARYDGAFEPFRRRVNLLRLALVAGGDAARAALEHAHLRALAAELADAYADARSPPARWDLGGLLAAVDALANEAAGAEAGHARAAGQRGAPPPPPGAAAARKLGDRAQLLVAVQDLQPEATAAALLAGLAAAGALPDVPRPQTPVRRRALAAAAARRARADADAARPRGAPARAFARLREWVGDLLVAVADRRRATLAGALAWELPHFGSAPRVGAVSILRVVERDAALARLDAAWTDFLNDSATLQRAAKTRAFAQFDPLDEFRLELGELFAALLAELRRASAAAALGAGVDLLEAHHRHNTGAAREAGEGSRADVAFAAEWVIAANAAAQAEAKAAAAAEAGAAAHEAHATDVAAGDAPLSGGAFGAVLGKIAQGVATKSLEDLERADQGAGALRRVREQARSDLDT